MKKRYPLFSLLILTVALLSNGCSTVSLVYRNADWYLLRKINGYTSFNTQQKATIHQEVTDYMHWHRRNALPEYIIFLQNLNGLSQYEGQLSIEEITQLRDQLLSLYRKTMVPTVRPASKLLSSLDGRQIQELGKTLNEENQELKEDVLAGSAAEHLNKRADKTIDFVEWLAGNLSIEQEQKVRAMSRHLPMVSPVFLQHRETNQGRLIALLNDNAGADKIAAFLSSWLLTPEATRTTQQQRVIQSFEIASGEMIVGIHGLLTARQKEHMHYKIASYIVDLQRLIAETMTTNGA